jgi:HSP20 family protein
LEIPRYNTPTVARIYRDQREDDRTRWRDQERLRDWMAQLPTEGAAGECVPPMDVLETADAVEVLLDLPGVPLSAIHVAYSEGTLIVSGHKLPEGCGSRDAAFHLAERSFGRFARAVRLNGAFDAGRASASLVGGELRIVLPRIEERRGRDIRIQITQP